MEAQQQVAITGGNNTRNNVKRRKFFRPGIVIFLLILALTAAGITIFLLAKDLNTKTDSQSENAGLAVKSKVEKLMYLPNETPQVMTMENADEVKKNNPFFKDVQNGDQVLIFLADSRVVIYRESENKIVNVGPIVNDSSKQESSE